MILYYQNLTKEFRAIEERLKSLSLAYKTQLNSEISDLILEEGKKKIIGHKAILEYLENLADELHKWYYCNC